MTFISVLQWLCTWRCAALLGILVLILLITVVISSIYFTRNMNAQPTPIFPEIPDSSINGNYAGKFFIDTI